MNVVKRAIYSAAGALGYHVGLRPPTADTLQGHLATLFDRLAFNCVIDVGAHQGGFGHLIRDLGYTGRIVSFEPVPSNLRDCRKPPLPIPSGGFSGRRSGPRAGSAGSTSPANPPCLRSARRAPTGRPTSRASWTSSTRL